MSPIVRPEIGAARIGRLLRTIRPLRPTQALAQLRHALVGVGVPRRASGPPPVLAIAAPATSFLPPSAHVKALGGDRFELLGQPFALPRGADWSRSAHGPLFAYHLHQHEFLRRPELDADERARVIGDWIASNRGGVGWDPHPLGLRLVAWGKLLTTAGALPDPARDPAARAALLACYADQAETLARHLEIRLQANHLLSNLLCVVFAGLLIEGSRSAAWRAHTARLVAELDAQIHPDGGHEERSPMYHASLLEGVLDLLNLCRAAPKRAPSGLETKLAAAAARMLRALAALTHPDGRIALFADSAFDIAAEPEALQRYAERLSIPVAGPTAIETAARTAVGSTCLADTGYVRLAAGDWLLIASAAGPAPAHQPGHAHCDALSFELSVAGRRLVADTGVFEYVAGERRQRARATASHATLQIDGEEQAEIWSAHRVGGRPTVSISDATSITDRGAMAEATCSGWSRPAVLHRRRFDVDSAGLVLVDSVEGPAREIRSRIPLAPGWEVRLVAAAPATATAAAPGGGALRAICRALDDPTLVIEIDLPAEFSWSLTTAPYSPRFGSEVSRPLLEGVARAVGAARTRFRRVVG